MRYLPIPYVQFSKKKTEVNFIEFEKNVYGLNTLATNLRFVYV